jgi:antitoxin FitA
LSRITIENVEEDLVRRLRERAAKNGRSLEEEAHAILRAAVEEPAAPVDLAAAIRSRVVTFGGAEIEIPSREPMRDPNESNDAGTPSRRIYE